MSSSAYPDLHTERAVARRRMVKRRRRTAAALLVLVLAAGGYVAACALAPLPDPVVTLTAEGEREVVADSTAVEAAVATRTLPTAVGWADGDAVWTNDETPYPLGSVTKLITMLVCMEAAPLAPGSDGETYVWTAADRAKQDYYLSLDGVAYPIPVGTKITQREMLKFIFLPSANDYAYAYTMMTFGTEEAFLEAASQFLATHGLTSTTIVEPTGMDDLNRSSASDLVRIARIALQNETIREFNGMQSAVMPWGIGLIENTNPLLGTMPGVIGVKTGMLSTVGYNLIAAQEITSFGRDLISISVTMARPSSGARESSGREMLTDMQSLPMHQNVVADGEVVGMVTSVTGQEIPIVTAGTADTVMIPGEATLIVLNEDTSSADSSGDTVGNFLVMTPNGDFEVPLVTTADIEQPDLWWRLTHPALVFGWA